MEGLNRLHELELSMPAFGGKEFCHDRESRIHFEHSESTQLFKIMASKLDGSSGFYTVEVMVNLAMYFQRKNNQYMPTGNCRSMGLFIPNEVMLAIMHAIDPRLLPEKMAEDEILPRKIARLVELMESKGLIGKKYPADIITTTFKVVVPKDTALNKEHLADIAHAFPCLGWEYIQGKTDPVAIVLLEVRQLGLWK